MKISIIGMGHVGSTLAYTLMLKGLGSELVLVNRSPERAVGDALDLQHAGSFVNHSMQIRAGSIEDTAGSGIIILTASIPKTPEIRSRLDLAPGNRGLVRELVPALVRLSPDTVLIVVTNPVDVMTWYALRDSGLPPSRVFGIGTLVDSARYRSGLSSLLGVHADDIRAYVLGEHGDSQFPAGRNIFIGAERLDPDDIAHILDESAAMGNRIMQAKGYTNYAIALATALTVEYIVLDSHKTVPVSTLISGYCGVTDVCLSIPAVLGRGGIIRPLYPELTQPEEDSFRQCARVVSDVIHHVGE